MKNTHRKPGGIGRLLNLGVVVATLLLGWSSLPESDAAEGDIVLKRQVDGGTTIPPAVFPHWFHRIRFKCYACHPAIFEMKAGANKISMDAITQEGKYCGACHNGKVAWAVSFEYCPKCHLQQ